MNPRQILRSVVDGLVISTVYDPEGVEPPIPGREPRKYETAVYETADEYADIIDCERCHTERKARDAHRLFAEKAGRGEFR